MKSYFVPVTLSIFFALVCIINAFYGPHSIILALLAGFAAGHFLAKIYITYRDNKWFKYTKSWREM